MSETRREPAVRDGDGAIRLGSKAGRLIATPGESRTEIALRFDETSAGPEREALRSAILLIDSEGGRH